MRWDAAPVGLVTRVNSSVLPESTAEDTEIEYLDIGSVGHGSLVESPDRITFGDAPSRARRRVEAGDVIVSTVRTYLRAVAHMDRPLVVSTGFATLTPGSPLDCRYLYYAVASDPFIESVVARSTGVSYPAIAPTELASIPVPLPPLEVQRRIAGHLDTETARIDSLLAKNTEVERLLASRVNSLRSQLLWPSAVAARAGIDPLSADLGVEGGLTRLQYVTRSRVPGGTPSTSDPAYWTDDPDEGLPWFGIGDFSAGGHTGAASRRASAEGVRAAGLPVRDKGTVLFALYGATAGKVGRLGERGTFNQAVLAIEPTPVVIRRYLFEWLQFIEPFVLAHVRGNTQPNFNGQQVAEFPIRVPPVEEQQEMVESLTKARRRVAALRDHLSRQTDLLRERRQALITAAVTGEVEV